MSYIWEKRPRIERYIYDSLSYLRDTVSSAEKITPMMHMQTAAKHVAFHICRPLLTYVGLF